MEIPAHRLSKELLERLIEDFVTREGTDYGHQERSLADKVDQVRQQIHSGKAFISFDPESESVTILPRPS